MTFAHLSEATALSQRVFHRSQNTFNRIQNSFMTIEIYDQGENRHLEFLCLLLDSRKPQFLFKLKLHFVGLFPFQP